LIVALGAFVSSLSSEPAGTALHQGRALLAPFLIEKEKNIMKRYTALTLTTAALLSIGASTVTRADEILKWRHVQHNISVQSLDVGDAKGHSLYLYQLPGIAFFPDGSLGSTMVVGTSDLTNGSGTNSGYSTLNFSDGSAIFMKYSGTNKTDGNRFPRQGTFVVIGGKGRYEGVKGDGTWEGDGTRSGPEAIIYIDNVINIKK
jgi:hypothetical protein